VFSFFLNLSLTPVLRAFRDSPPMLVSQMIFELASVEVSEFANRATMVIPFLIFRDQYGNIFAQQM